MWLRRLGIITGALLALGISLAGYLYYFAEPDIYVYRFASSCGGCHGDDLEGTEHAQGLLGRPLEGGDTVAGLMQSIAHGNPERGMPAFIDQMSEEEIKGLAIYIAERRLGLDFDDFRYNVGINVPETVVSTEKHAYRFEVFADHLDPQPFSIEPMPDGSLLLTEKQRGLSIVSPGGEQTYITGTPETGFYNFDVRGVKMGVGWLLDVALHPDYDNNGWIYLHYTELCGDDCDSSSIFPKSFNKLERGRIIDGAWRDVQTIWEIDHAYYSPVPDTGAGGRITFDDSGHVYISVGIKPEEALRDHDSQDLALPSGKIYRINDDGTIPADNPFVVSTSGQDSDAPAFRRTIWTYGHRSPQGLEWNPVRRHVWNSEMGPRGGDEINELLPGRNYGWPYYSLGLEYDGRKVSRHEHYDIEFDENDIERTLVDLTPSPAASSFAFYEGDSFPAWRNDVLLGSLKARSLYRLEFDGRTFIRSELIVDNLGRIRDVEIGFDGHIYLLLESSGGSKIVRMVPADDEGLMAGTGS